VDARDLERLTDRLNSLPRRDPDRIPEILGLIEQVWRRHPDMRLGQLIVNLLDPRPNPIFAIEDETLRDRLKTVLETSAWPTQSNQGEGNSPADG
jgi:hypothetical protein